LVFAQKQEDQVLVGVGKDCAPNKPEIFQVYAVAKSIVVMVVDLKSPATYHAFVLATTRTGCCPPAEQVGTFCFRCCDSTYICTRDGDYKKILVGSAKLSEKEWMDLINKGLDSVKGWADVKALLQRTPPVALSKDDPRVTEFLQGLEK
jgi:hypothetical protein